MSKNIRLAFLILLVSGGLAVGVNELRRDNQRLEYIREIVPPPPPSPAPGPSGATGPTGHNTPLPSPPISPVSPGINEVRIDDVLLHLESGEAKFVDARGAQDFEEGHLRYALNVPSDDIYNQMENVMQTIGQDDKVIVYCGGGECEASHKVAEVLLEYKFTDVSVYVKGWEEVVQSKRFEGLTSTGDQP